MSVQNITRRAGPYVGTGLVSAYTFAFKVFRPEDVKVVRSASSDANAQDETLKLGTDYTVKLNANQDEKAGGTVTLVSPLAEGLRLSVLSAVTPDQQMVLTNHDGFLPTTLNDSADKAIALIQELQELLGRGITVPATSAMSPAELLNELVSAAKDARLSAEEAQRFAEICEEIKQNIFIYSWDIPHVVDTLEDVANYPYDGFFAVGGYGDPGHHGQDISNRFVKAKGSTELRTLGERFSDVVNVRDFGAVGDGKLAYDGTIKYYDGATDDADAIQAAISACERRGGGTVLIPPGIYMCSHTLNLPSGIALAGAGPQATIIAIKVPNYLDLTAYKSYVDFDLLSLEGADSTFAGHVHYICIRDLTLSSNLLDGPSQVMGKRQIAEKTDPIASILSTDKVSYLLCTNVVFYGRGRHLYSAETWDSKFMACDFQASGCIPEKYPTYSEEIKEYASASFDSPAVDLQFFAPRPGATGTSNCNNLYFTNCRFESYVNTAFKSNKNKEGNGGNNSIFLVGCKFESHGNIYHNVIHNDSASNFRMVSCLVGQDTRNRAHTVFLKNTVGAYIDCYLSITKTEERVRDTESIYCEGVSGSIFNLTCNPSIKVGGGCTDASIFKQSDIKSLCRMNKINVAPGGDGYKIFAGNTGGIEYLYDTQELRLHSKGVQKGITLKTDQAALEWHFGQIESLGSGVTKAKFVASNETDSYTPLELYINAVCPGNDANVLLGTASKRWSQVYAATGTINTSDAREKTSIVSPDDSLMRAWGKVNFKVFQFKDAVEKKGVDARLHVGVIAQQVIEAFASEGLDATRYGLLCYDKWDDEYEDVEIIDQVEVADEKGDVVTPAKTHIEHRLVTPAGDRYGIRYEEALALECAYLRRELKQIKQNQWSA